MRTKHFQTSSFNVFPNDLNYGNTLFGGKVMSEVDCEAAKAAKSVLAGTNATNAVTKTFNVDFIAPGRQGDLVVMEADVTAMGKSSITIVVDVYRWNGPDRSNWVQIGKVNTVFVALKDGVKYEHGLTMNDLYPVYEPSADLVNLLRRSTGAGKLICRAAILEKKNGTVDEWISWIGSRASKLSTIS